MVRLEGIQKVLSHNDVLTAVEKFGKTKSIILLRSTREVCSDWIKVFNIVFLFRNMQNFVVRIWFEPRSIQVPTSYYTGQELM